MLFAFKSVWGFLSFCEKATDHQLILCLRGNPPAWGQIKDATINQASTGFKQWQGLLLLLLVIDSQRPHVVEWSLRPRAHKHNGPLINRQSRWNYTQGHYYPPLKRCCRVITQLFSHHKFFVVSANALVILRQQRAQYNSLKPAIWGTSHVSSIKD